MGTNNMIRASGGILAILLVIVASTAIGTPETPLQGFSTSSAIDDSNLDGLLIAGNDNPRIAVVKPIFTDTAYSSAFYVFYGLYASSTEPFITTDLDLFNVTVKDGWGWSKRFANFLNSLKASLAGLSIGQNVALIDEIDVTTGALFDEDRRVYDVVILGFTEYVTLEEYYYYKRFVETGGTLIIMDACNFLAEVKYHPPTSPGEVGYLSLVKGHGWEFNGTHAWKSAYHRWPEENRNWVGGNYWKWWSGIHYDFFLANTSHPISTYIRNNYEQNVTTIYRAHEENRLENLTETQIIGYWNFIDPNEAPEDPVAAYQHKYGSGSVFHTGIMASDVIDVEEFLQAFLVSAVRMGLSGEVGEWAFWEDSSFQHSSKMYYENGTQVPPDGCISGVVTFYVGFNTSIIVQNQKPYSLTSVYACIYRQDSVFSSKPSTVHGNVSGEDSLNWQIVVDTCNLSETEYAFEIVCRFTSVSNISDYLESTLMVAIHKVDNFPDEIMDSLYVSLGSIATILVFVCVCIVLNGRRNVTVG
ncbi:MAG: hypothetical protein ACFFEA_04345 [Candidatus Thorarchaeota archaeon]